MHDDRRPRLLVSVRNAGEAASALEGGADLIDVKEPARGSLGAAAEQTWIEVARAVGVQRPLSAALGELVDWRPADSDALAGYQFAKLGLSDCRREDHWLARLQSVLNTFPSNLRPVAVAYADWQAAKAPPPEQVLAAAKTLNCSAVLLDTFFKGGPTLLDHCSLDQLSEWIASVRREELACVIAGSLTENIVEQLMPERPDVIALRGAVCRDGRVGVVDAGLVSKFVDLIDRNSANRCAIA